MARTSHVLALLVALLGLVTACASPSEKLLAEGMGFLDDAIALVLQHKGDEDAIVQALRGYVEAHRDAFRDNTRRGRALLDGMGEAERAAFVQRARDEAAPRMTRLQTLVAPYKRKVEILALVSSFNH
jgi:hypothetical protein